MIIWKQIIKYATENNIESLVFITDDVKDDWWLDVNGKTIGPRPELASELYASTPVKHFHMYKSEQFLKLASHQLGIEVDNNSVEQVKVITETSFQDFENVLNHRRASEIRRMYQNRCQVCGQGFSSSGKSIVEAAHIVPISQGGSTTFSNMLCLCPNHHKMFDHGAFSVGADYRLIGIPGELTVHPKHIISPASLKFHRENIYSEKVVFEDRAQPNDDDIPF